MYYYYIIIIIIIIIYYYYHHYNSSNNRCVILKSAIRQNRIKILYFHGVDIFLLERKKHVYNIIVCGRINREPSAFVTAQKFFMKERPVCLIT